jgi:hypothetical protein
MSRWVPAEPVSTGQFFWVIGMLMILGVLGWFVLPAPLDWVSIFGFGGGIFIACWIHVRQCHPYKYWS